jgi:hypothetical protein
LVLTGFFVEVGFLVGAAAATEAPGLPETPARADVTPIVPIKNAKNSPMASNRLRGSVIKLFILHQQRTKRTRKDWPIISNPSLHACL